MLALVRETLRGKLRRRNGAVADFDQCYRAILGIDDRRAGRPVHSNDDLSAALQTGQGSAVTILYRRGGHEYTAQLTPWADASGVYKAGLWVRDSSAGIGTLTFVDPVAGTFAGLGHPISDVDTGADFTLLSGEIVPVTVTGVRSASPGTAGELRGEFLSDILGIVTGNDATGLYGRWTYQVPLMRH